MFLRKANRFRYFCSSSYKQLSFFDRVWAEIALNKDRERFVLSFPFESSLIFSVTPDNINCTR